MSYKEFETIGTCDGVPVIYCPNTLIQEGVSIACATIFINEEGGTFHGIGIDDSFLVCPGKIQDFFVYHELGHIRNGDIGKDIDNSKWVKIRESGTIPEMEFNADRYAFDRIVSSYGITDAKEIVQSIRTAFRQGIDIATSNVTKVGCAEMVSRMDTLLS